MVTLFTMGGRGGSGGVRLYRTNHTAATVTAAAGTSSQSRPGRLLSAVFFFRVFRRPDFEAAASFLLPYLGTGPVMHVLEQVQAFE